MALVICCDTDSKKLLIPNSSVLGLIQIMYTVCWWGLVWKPPIFALSLDPLPQLSSVSLYLYTHILSCFLSYLYWCAQVCPVQTNNPLWISYISKYRFILFLFKDLCRAVLLIVFFNLLPFFFSLRKFDLLTSHFTAFMKPLSIRSVVVS